MGIVSAVEMPTRQSIVGRVVPPEMLSMAVPVQSLTFNVARVLGPALGTIILVMVGVATCYLLNGISFLALIWAAVAIKANLQSEHRQSQPIRDLIVEGVLYTLRERRLRALFLLEAITAACGLAYLPMMPAYVHQVLRVGTSLSPAHLGKLAETDASKQVLGSCYTAVGVGAITGLLLVTQYAEARHKAGIVRLAMWTLGSGLCILSICRVTLVAYPVLVFMGAASVCQLTTTNALFQLLSPDRLRGRVLAMHLWAINGFSPFGVLLFGWIARSTRVAPIIRWGSISLKLPITGVPLSLQLGAACVLAGAIAASLAKRSLADLP
jgi:predicted MFS family arabinose efflux permease